MESNLVAKGRLVDILSCPRAVQGSLTLGELMNLVEENIQTDSGRSCMPFMPSQKNPALPYPTLVRTRGEFLLRYGLYNPRKSK
ncbi:MAG: hypothetical protein GY847_08170 [Proteobacteria bacterium]|nr:hypothetical protein [Pseudomonadota bacterium]